MNASLLARASKRVTPGSSPRAPFHPRVDPRSWAAFVRTCAFVSILASAGWTQILPRSPIARPLDIVVDRATRIADPKLDGGGADILLHLAPANAHGLVHLDVLRGNVVVASPWAGTLSGGQSSTALHWDGKDAAGRWSDTGDYTLRISALGAPTVDLPLRIVRVGIARIAFEDSPLGPDEFQMVYFKKGSNYVYYATPGLHEYSNVQSAGELADLDLDDGNPRTNAPLHTLTDAPVMNGTNYEIARYDYPVAYIQGAAPHLDVTIGNSAVSSSGSVSPPAYPLAGFEVRLQARIDGIPVSDSTPIQPGATVGIDLPALPSQVSRVDRAVEWHFQYRESQGNEWFDVPGSTTTQHRFYTILDTPRFKNGASGMQYAGPWVEVCDYAATWSEALRIPAFDAQTLTEVHVRGFFGQNSGIQTPIEGVLYDSGPLGGDGGATHYFSFSSWAMDLSSLLDAHSRGVFVNCSDCMGATTTMLSMLGVDNVRPVRLGFMNLRAIWGIGAPGYTTNLWGPGNTFSYHHIVTDTNGLDVTDACLQVDEDGMPGSAPGIPGWNHHRPWSGALGYNTLVSSNAVTRSYELLPGLK